MVGHKNFFLHFAWLLPQPGEELLAIDIFEAIPALYRTEDGYTVNDLSTREGTRCAQCLFSA